MNRVQLFAAVVLSAGVALLALVCAPNASASQRVPASHLNPANCQVSYDELPDAGPCIWLAPELGDGRNGLADGPFRSFGLDEAGVFHPIPSKPCVSEDGSVPGGSARVACYWHSAVMGNGQGSSYWLDKLGRAHDMVTGAPM